MKVLVARLSTILAFSSLLLVGCGGGGGGGGASPPPPTTPPPPVSPPPPPTGGITRTGVAGAAGPITEFGSVWVNGVRYHTDASTVFIRGDDSTKTQDDFSLGETVIITGTIDDDNTNAVALTVELDEIVEGPVSAGSVNGNLFTVMGQTVRAGDGTLIDNNCDAGPGNLGPLELAFAVEVYGSINVDAAGDEFIDATRVECKTAIDVDEFEVNGIVSERTDTTFMINNLQVDYVTGGAVIDSDFPGGVITNGDPVEVKGPPANFTDGASPVLVATKVDYKGNVLGGDEGDHLEVDGFISNFVSATSFDLRTGTTVISVTTTSNTLYEGGSSADLANNLKIEVEGELNADGDLQATKIEIKDSTNIRVTGLVDSVEGNVITILNIRVNTSSGSTEFEDNSDARMEPFAVGDVNAGDYVEARGQEQPEGEITAFEIRREDPDPDTELRGFVEDNSVSGRNSFVILDVTVDTSSVSPGNYFTEDAAGNDVPITADEFWNAVGTGGVIVDVTGSETGTSSMQARELQLEPLD